MSEFPAHWDIKNIGNFASRVRRKNTGGECQDPMTISAIDGLVSQRDYFNKIVASKNTEGYTLLHKNDFAYNKSYSDGYPVGAARRFKTKDRGIVSPLYICFELDREQIDLHFADYLFDSDWFVQAIYGIAKEGARSHGLLNIGIEEFFSASLPTPPLPEQKKIAEILSGIDIVIETTNNKIAKLRKSKVTLLHAFFQERSDGQAGIANLGGEVIRKRFGECLGIISGKGFEAKDYSASGTRLLRIDNVSWETISWESVAYLPENIVKENQKLLLSEGDILLALNRPITQDKLKIARCSKGDLPAILYQRVGKIFTLDESTISNDFAYYLLQGLLPDFIASQSVGSDQPFINLTALRDLMLPLPQTDLQEKIVETLKSIDNSTAIHSKRVFKFLLLRKSLSSDLLSGRKRVSI